MSSQHKIVNWQGCSLVYWSDQLLVLVSSLDYRWWWWWGYSAPLSSLDYRWWWCGGVFSPLELPGLQVVVVVEVGVFNFSPLELSKTRQPF